MKYGKLTLGQIEAIVNRLGGEADALRFLRGELIVTEPPRIFADKIIPKAMETWLTISVGRFRNIAGAQLAGFKGEVANLIHYEQFERDVDLVKVSVLGLGLTNGVNLFQIYEAARQVELTLCPPEAAFVLRKHLFTLNPKEMWELKQSLKDIRIAMEPIIGVDTSTILGFTSCGGHGETYDAHPPKGYSVNQHFLFEKLRT